VQWSDLEAVAKLIYDVCAADGDTIVAVTPQELKHEWEDPDFNLERDAFLVETSDGRVVGFEEFNSGHAHAILHTDGYVHPEFRGRGIGTTLLGRIEERALEEMTLAEPYVRVSLIIVIFY
jgi:GNAT superfamily N-acetyltransferase